MKNKKKIKQNIISHFNKRKNGDAVNIVPKDKNPIPKILNPIEKKKKEQPKKEQNYIPTELNESILKLNKRIDFIINKPKDYLNTKTIEKHYTDTKNNNTIEKHYNTDTKNNKRIINIPKEIKIPSVINPVSIEEKASHKETKNIKNVQNNIKKMLFHNHHRNETKNNNVRNNKNIKLPTITNNTNNNKNPLSFTINKTNISNKALSNILERNTDTNTNRINKKYFTIDKSTVNKILSGKSQVPKTIPAYGEGTPAGSPVERTFGGKLALLADKGEDEIVTPVSKIKETKIKDTMKDGNNNLRPVIRQTVNQYGQNSAQIIKNQNQTLSTVANKSMLENKTLKQQESETAKPAVDSTSAPTIINNTTNNNNNSGNGPSQSFGGGTKASESMGLQTQYPIWRRGFG